MTLSPEATWPDGVRVESSRAVEGPRAFKPRLTTTFSLQIARQELRVHVSLWAVGA